MSTEQGHRVGAWVVAVSIGGTVLLGIGAFWLSFTALADLAVRAGTPAELAWVWPLIVDGVTVIATMSVVALSPHGARATRYLWLLLAGAALVSASANTTHAFVAAGDGVPGVLAGIVASVPPIVLLAVTHLTVELARYRRRSPIRQIPEPQGSVKSLLSEKAVSVPPVRVLSSSGVTQLPENGQNKSVRERARTDDGNSDQKKQAIRLRDDGFSNRQIAERLGVHPSTIGRWLKGPPAQVRDLGSERKYG